ncbi:MAG TPA: prepilin-type N-terminal cleavage/methylation domain-containing protein [Pontiellaceae bacterium]|nr:prepilin-type N-terminal cleavage/methylation domain-containing protein [Pontiellaceae bacterium]HPR82370.1 prepilin-type N-terminal cleavage/methylation domain-containing protein [Pontiellaceae bacterium]
MNRKKNKQGFTIIEVLLATVIAIMVFAALGLVMTKCFALWKDATSHWQLAQYARISRERILCGGFADPSGGLLSATNAVTVPDSGWSYLQYITVAGSGAVQQVRGWNGEADDKSIQLKNGSSSWVYGQASGDAEPVVKVDSFSATVSNDLVTVVYRLKLSAAGKSFTQMQTIHACLVNKE